MIPTPRYIELLRGRGYRLIPPVAVDSREAAGEPRGARIIGIVATMIALALAGLIWLASGTDPVLNVLSRSTPLKVTAQTSSFSFKGRNADVAKIAQTLHVSHVLEGSVRTSGTRIRINAQLVSTADGIHV